jgi:hypothetical protein
MTRTVDRPPCWTNWDGRRIDDPCDQCGHLLIQHVRTGSEARCLVCAWLDVLEAVARGA